MPKIPSNFVKSLTFWRPLTSWTVPSSRGNIYILGLSTIGQNGLKQRRSPTQRRPMGENRASWSDKLDDALWALRTAYKTPIRCTPYKLVYVKACHLPDGVGSTKLLPLNMQTLISKLREKTKRIHDAKIKNRVFNVGDQVLLFNSRLKIFSGKLKSRWSGPFTIVQVFPYGTVELSQNSGPNFKVNGHRLKHYFGGDIPAMDIPDLQTFLRTTKFRELVKASDLNKRFVRHPMLNPVYHSSRFPGFLKPLVLAVFVLRSQELHNPQLHLGIPIS
ncbi:reverse transcriptase domain-containing protein [Tanacetum coccineum]